MKKLTTIAAALLASAIMVFAKDVKLIWEPNPIDEQVTHYNLYKKVGTVYTLLVSNILSTNVTLTNLANGKYIFVVTAVNYWGESDYSNEASTPNDKTPPKNLRLLSQ